MWLSEVILQQTTIRQGTDYYLRFLKRWPTVGQLAAATEGDVLREWQGLGYYTRARNLHAAAKAVVAAGRNYSASRKNYSASRKNYSASRKNYSASSEYFPASYAELRALPGVGDYTAAAVASIAFGLPHAVVDGNVYRVLSRYFGLATPIDTPAGRREFAALAQELLDEHHPGRHNQAMMDFGALQCTPHSPRCADCPLADSCVALATGSVESLPVKARRVKVQEVSMDYTLVCSPEGLLLRQRPVKGIWAKLWEPPLTEELPSTLVSRSAVELGLFRHQLTHRTITCRATALPLSSLTIPPSALRLQFVPWDDLDNHALPRLIQNIIERCRNKISE